jgi:hypothetical protein
LVWELTVSPADVALMVYEFPAILNTMSYVVSWPVWEAEAALAFIKAKSDTSSLAAVRRFVFLTYLCQPNDEIAAIIPIIAITISNSTSVNPLEEFGFIKRLLNIYRNFPEQAPDLPSFFCSSFVYKLCIIMHI